MILSDLRDYLLEHRRAALLDMALKFDADPKALRGMLAVFERKGRIRRLNSEPACGNCHKCDPAAVELYEWIDRK